MHLPFNAIARDHHGCWEAWVLNICPICNATKRQTFLFYYEEKDTTGRLLWFCMASTITIIHMNYVHHSCDNSLNKEMLIHRKKLSLYICRSIKTERIINLINTWAVEFVKLYAKDLYTSHRHPRQIRWIIFCIIYSESSTLISTFLHVLRINAYPTIIYWIKVFEIAILFSMSLHLLQKS